MHQPELGDLMSATETRNGRIFIWWAQVAGLGFWVLPVFRTDGSWGILLFGLDEREREEACIIIVVVVVVVVIGSFVIRQERERTVQVSWFFPPLIQ